MTTGRINQVSIVEDVKKRGVLRPNIIDAYLRLTKWVNNKCNLCGTDHAPYRKWFNGSPQNYKLLLAEARNN